MSDEPQEAASEKAATAKQVTAENEVVRKLPQSDHANFEAEPQQHKDASDLPDVGQNDERSNFDHSIADGASSAYAQKEKPEPPPLMPDGDDNTAAAR